MKTNSFNLSFFDEKLAIKNFDDKNNRVVGYARLSFDEDGSGYCSIINQKDLLQSVYDSGFKQDSSTYSFLADDNVSGYKFDRPSLKTLLSMIEQGECNIVLAKDLSRIGRHGALTQLFIEQCERVGIRVYAMDDYDSHKESDDLILGIKTWSNERYVKDASQKVRKIIKHKQENGTWVCSVPFGYVVEDYKNPVIKIDDEAAEIVREIYDLYLDGNGIKKIASMLTERNVPTSSMLEMARAFQKGKEYKRTVTRQWTSSRISNILNNDFYIGTLRTGKYTRRGINGADVRKNEEQHNVFENHHSPIIDISVYNAVRDKWNSNKKENYRHKGVEHLFHGILECGECGSKLYCYSRKDLDTQYICSQNFKYGLKGCTRHRVKESLLIDITVSYLQYIRDNCLEVINSIGKEISNSKNAKHDIEKRNKKLQSEIEEAKHEINVIEEQRIKQIIAHPEREENLNVIYDNLHSKTQKRIEDLEQQLSDLSDTNKNVDEDICRARTALEVIDDIISEKDITRKDVVELFDKIVVHDDGRIVVKAKPYLEGIESYKLQIEDKPRNQKKKSYGVGSTNEVSNGDPLNTIFVKYLSILRGVHILSEKIRKKRGIMA